MAYDIVAGTTSAILFQLLDKSAPIDLTGISVALLLEDRTGTTVSSPGAIAVTDATNGKVSFTPTDANVFSTALGPYYARWQLTDGFGLISFVPSSIRDVWNIIRK